MPLQSSGAISLNDIQNEFGGSNPIGLNEYYGAASGIPSSGTISLNLFYGASAAPLFSHTFTNAGATGRTGPTLTQVQNAYSGSGVSVSMNVQGIQLWTVPATGSYEIEVAGAHGGGWHGSGTHAHGGNGGWVKGTASLTQGVVLAIIVGQQGSDMLRSGGAGGGGGASFVMQNSNFGSFYGIAGGGGGANGPQHTSGAYGSDGGSSQGNGGDTGGGANGNYGNGGGCGFNNNGSGSPSQLGGTAPYIWSGGQVVSSPVGGDHTYGGGATGYSVRYPVDGGFGGGGASSWHTAGGGGGWAGGDGAYDFTPPDGGGGTTYGGMSNQTYGTHTASHGYVKITTNAYFVHVFTNAGATGRTGPTLTQIQNAYSSTSWASDTSKLNMTTQGYQIWTVPKTATYEFKICGARGGHTTSGRGGYSRYITGRLALKSGDKLTLIVGQEGGVMMGNGWTNPNSESGGGGGGSFVVIHTAVDYSSTTLMLAAGGGGGGGTQGSHPTCAGNDVRSDNYSTYQIGTAYLNNGNGGGIYSSNYNGGGGGGWNSDGTSRTTNYDGQGGHGYSNGFTGGEGARYGHSSVPWYDGTGNGGFGGGGGAWNNSEHRPGGGGGYSGGEGASYEQLSNGGGGAGGNYINTSYVTSGTYGAQSTDVHGSIQIKMV